MRKNFYFFLITDTYFGGIKTYIDNFNKGIYFFNKSDNKKNIKINFLLIGRTKNERELFIKNLSNNYSKIFFIKYNFLNLIYYFEIIIKSFFFFFKRHVFYIKNKNTIFILNTIRSGFLIFVLRLIFLNKKNIKFYFQFHGFYDLEKYIQENFIYINKEDFFLFKLKNYFKLLFKYFLRKYIFIFILIFSDKIIAFSKYSRDKLISHYKINKNKIMIVKPGVIFDFLEKKEKNKNYYYLFNKNFLKIGFFQRLEPRKNLLELIYILKDIIKINEKIILIINTPFNYMILEYLQKISMEINSISDRVIFINNGFFIYNEIDLMVVPSLELETFSFVSFECLINDIPVIASYNSGVRDYLINNKYGFLFKDFKDLKEKLFFIIKNKKMIKKFRLNIQKDKKKIISNFNWNNYINSLINNFLNK